MSALGTRKFSSLCRNNVHNSRWSFCILWLDCQYQQQNCSIGKWGSNLRS